MYFLFTLVSLIPCTLLEPKKRHTTLFILTLLKIHWYLHFSDLPEWKKCRLKDLSVHFLCQSTWYREGGGGIWEIERGRKVWEIKVTCRHREDVCSTSWMKLKINWVYCLAFTIIIYLSISTVENEWIEEERRKKLLAMAGTSTEEVRRLEEEVQRLKKELASKEALLETMRATIEKTNVCFGCGWHASWCL